MYGFFLRFLILIYALWLLRRLIGYLVGASKRRAAQGGPRGARPEPASGTVKDPVCGMYMDPRLAMRVECGKDSVFFCSKECKEKYLSQPR